MTEPTGGTEGYPADPADVHEALYRLQAERIVLAKDQDGQVGNQKTKYADLVQANEVILPRLFALGLLWLTSPTLRMIPGPNGQEDPRFVLDWTLRHIPSKTSIDGTYPLMDAGTAMKAGSAITYARRYALIAITNAVAQDEDDDGRGGQGRGGLIQRNQPPRPAASRGETAQRTPPAGREKARPAAAPPAPEPHRRAEHPAGGEPLRGRGGLITEPMTRKLAISMRDAGITGDDRLATVIGMTGRHDLTTSKDLTFNEGRAAIDAVEKAKGKDDAAVVAIDIYHRAGGPTVNGGPAAAEAVPTAEQAETGHPPTKRAARKAEPRTAPRTLAESVVGTPDPNAGPAPWEDGHQYPIEEPPDDGWPETAQPPQ